MFDSQGNFLFHGQDWKKHKYIRKEGDKYIYPEDAKKSSGSRAGMPSNIKKTNVLSGGQAVGEVNGKAAVSTNTRLNKSGSAYNGPIRVTTKAQSMTAAREMQKGKNKLPTYRGAGGEYTAMNELKKAGKAAINNLRKNKNDFDKGKGSKAGMPSNLGNRSTTKKEVSRTNNGYGGEYTARTEVQKVINKIPKENRRVVSRTTSATSGDYTETIKDGNGKLLSKRKGNTFRDSSNSGRATAESERKKGRAKVAGREASEKTTNWVNQKNSEREAKNKKIQENNPNGYYGRMVRKAKEKSESYNEEEEKMKKKLGADTVTSSGNGEGVHYYKNGKEVKYNGVADTERSKGEAIEKKNNAIGSRIMKTAKNIANSYDEMHERQSDALIRATENGRNKVKSLLENTKRNKRKKKR